MNDYEKAKQYYYHEEYQKAIELILILTKKNSTLYKDIEYPNILCYLGDSRLKLYKISTNKSLINKALTDYTTCKNSLNTLLHTNSSFLDARIKRCLEIMFKK